MLATLWIHGRVCRILVRDENGNIYALNDCWSNRCSAEVHVMDWFPTADIKFLPHGDQSIPAMNAMWDATI